jgi:hypothetical protein
MAQLNVVITYDEEKVTPETILTHLRALVFRFEGLVDVNEAKPPRKRAKG